jgi:hypothetical protein
MTFSRYFASGHPRKGQPTQFIEKILLSLIEIGHISIGKACEIGREMKMEGFQYIDELRKLKLQPKHHTIRAGNRWKPGDLFSPRIWTGNPYKSKQFEFVYPVEVKKTWSFEVDENGVPSLNGIYLFDTDETKLLAEQGIEKTIATNDGLTWQDWNDWLIMPCFKKAKPFIGQIICWNEEINY